ncbi:hypothetical protein BH10BAC5_BH10BAC5_27670 [soil metagenome]
MQFLGNNSGIFSRILCNKVSNIKKYDMKRNVVVTRVIQRMLKLQQKMQAEKALVLKEVSKFVEYAGKQSNYKKKYSAIKGNITLTDFTGCFQVEMKRHDLIFFDERLAIAKAIIDDLMVKWSEGAHPNMKQIISEAFKVDKKGNVNKAMILGICKLSINDPDWELAVKQIRESIDIKGTKDYIQFKRRNNPEEDFEAISLDFSSLATQ